MISLGITRVSIFYGMNVWLVKSFVEWVNILVS